MFRIWRFGEVKMKKSASFNFYAKDVPTILICGGILFLLISFGASFVSKMHALGIGLVGGGLLILGIAIYFHEKGYF